MSKNKLLLKIFLIISAVEALIMMFLDSLVHVIFGFAHDGRLVDAALDVVLLTVIAGPLIYNFAVRPFEKERDHARDRLVQEVQNLEDAQMIGRVGSWQFLDDQKTLLFSKEALRLLELDPNQDVWPFQDVIERVHEADKKFVEKIHADMATNGESFTIVYRLKRRDGGERWVRERGILPRGLEQHYRGTILDITESKMAEGVRKRFVSAITHELRTPLTAIKGSFGLIKAFEGEAMQPKAASLIEVGQNASERLLRLIDELLDYDKISAGKIDLKMETLDLSEILLEAIEANHVFADSLGVKLETRGLTTRATVLVDRDRIIQVITNLLSNAAKASGDGESVQVSLDREAEAFCITISDHGPGIAEAVQPLLFQEFVQSSSSYRAKVASTGLGLSIAKEIVEMHGGSIGFNSTEGEGSRFFFTVPLAA